MLVTLFVTLILCILIGIPISVSLGLAAIFSLLIGGMPLLVVVQKIFVCLDSFLLMAIPLFIMAGELMVHSGLIEDLIKFSRFIVGNLRGGLGHASVIGSMIFSGASGSAIADASALGAVLIPATIKEYHHPDLSAALIASASTIGPIIPPSIPMIIYAYVGDVSVIALFVAGILPGIIMGLGLMSIWYFIALNRKFPVSKQRIRVIEIGEGFIKSFPAMFMPVVVIGGIVWGIFTPTEAAAVAFFYVVVCGFLVTRKLRLKHIQSALIRSASITAVTYLLLGTSGVISWEFTILHIPEKAAALFMEISSSPIVFLLLVNVFLLVLGMLIEPIPAMILLVPILHPIAVSYGINPVHFGIIVVLNLVIGLLTPPVGPCLFIDCAIAQISLERGTRAVAPFLIMLIVILFLLTYIPYLVLWLPGKFNLL